MNESNNFSASPVNPESTFSPSPPTDIPPPVGPVLVQQKKAIHLKNIFDEMKEVWRVAAEKQQRLVAWLKDYKITLINKEKDSDKIINRLIVVTESLAQQLEKMSSLLSGFDMKPGDIESIFKAFGILDQEIITQSNEQKLKKPPKRPSLPSALTGDPSTQLNTVGSTDEPPSRPASLPPETVPNRAKNEKFSSKPIFVTFLENIFELTMLYEKHFKYFEAIKLNQNIKKNVKKSTDLDIAAIPAFLLEPTQRLVHLKTYLERFHKELFTFGKELKTVSEVSVDNNNIFSKIETSLNTVSKNLEIIKFCLSTIDNVKRFVDDIKLNPDDLKYPKITLNAVNLVLPEDFWLDYLDENNPYNLDAHQFQIEKAQDAHRIILKTTVTVNNQHLIEFLRDHLPFEKNLQKSPDRQSQKNNLFSLTIAKRDLFEVASVINAFARFETDFNKLNSKRLQFILEKIKTSDEASMTNETMADFFKSFQKDLQEVLRSTGIYQKNDKVVSGFADNLMSFIKKIELYAQIKALRGDSLPKNYYWHKLNQLFHLVDLSIKKMDHSEFTKSLENLIAAAYEKNLEIQVKNLKEKEESVEARYKSEYEQKLEKLEKQMAEEREKLEAERKAALETPRKRVQDANQDAFQTQQKDVENAKKEFEDKNVALMKQTKQLEDGEEALKRKKANFEAQKEDFQKKEADFESAKEVFEDKNTKLITQVKQLKDKQEVLETKEAVLEAREKALQTKETDFQLRENELKKKEANFKQVKIKIKNKEAQIQIYNEKVKGSQFIPAELKIILMNNLGKSLTSHAVNRNVQQPPVTIDTDEDESASSSESASNEANNNVQPQSVINMHDIDKIENIFNSLEIQRSRFTAYMNAYCERANSNAFFGENTVGFFSYINHTANGIKNAKTCLKTWDGYSEAGKRYFKENLCKKIIDALKNNENDSTVEEIAMAEFKKILEVLNINAKALLSEYRGHTRQHSAKTYMMAYIQENQDIIETVENNNNLALNKKDALCDINIGMFLNDTDSAREKKVNDFAQEPEVKNTEYVQKMEEIRQARCF